MNCELSKFYGRGFGIFFITSLNSQATQTEAMK